MPADAAGDLSRRVGTDRGWRLWPVAALRSAGLPFGLLAGFAEAAPAAVGGARPGLDGLLLREDYREALTWQNPDAVANWAGAYAASALAGTPVTLDRMERREALIARYAQRYCAKNDTIGFFGPVAWAELGGLGTAVRGSGFLSRTEVGFEVWAVQAVARAWNADPALAGLLPVYLDPSVEVSDGVVRRPLRTAVPVGDAAQRLADRLRATPDGIPAGEIERGPDAAALDGLRRAGAVRAGFRVPIGGHPEQHVRRQIEQLPDEAARHRLRTLLDGLDKARQAVVDSDSADALAAALGDVDRALAVAAGHEVRPAPGLTPGGRTPLYLDCRRDLDAVIGDEDLAALATPLSILLDSARWLAGEVGQVAHDELVRRYRELRAGRTEVTLADLQFAAADLLTPACELYQPVREDFQARWAEILPAGPDDAAIAAAPARELADVLFRAAGRLWAAARTHSPDIMLRRRPDDGGLAWVLGELHVALNTLESRVFAAQADDPAAMVAAVAADGAEGRVVPVYPSSAPEVSSRTYPPLALDPPGRYRYWSYGSDEGHDSGAASTPAAGLIVTERDGDLVATASRDGWRAPVLECFGEFLTAVVVNMFQIRAPREAAPRIDIGDLTVCRRQWRFEAGQIAAAPRRSRDAGHDLLRRWADLRGLPRHVFVKTPAEPKPFYVDFAAPALVGNLARAVRRLASADPVDVVEMLPDPDGLWLADPGGARYTSELRIVAVDPEPHPAASWDLEGNPDA